MRDLSGDYVNEVPELMAFFARPPRDLLTASPRTPEWDPGLVTALAEYQERLGGRPLFMGNEAVVITGQQPGLFTGPLYTIYKTISTIVLAKRIHERFGAPCVPVFWVASDDHDFEEVRTARFLTKSHEDLALTYTPEQRVDALPMYRVPLEEPVHALIDEAVAQTPGAEFRDEVADFLHASLDASASLSDWTARLIMRLFRDTPLIVFSPHLPVARTLAAEVLEKDIKQPLAGTQLVNEAGERLKALDYPQQVSKAPAECSFFVEMGGRRRKVLFEHDQFRLPDEQLACPTDEMLSLLQSAPERFSPNVALRCIVQQHLFPAVAYVAGPGELAYWAQLKPLFEHFGEDMPAVYPRARCVLTNIKTNKLMDRFGFSVEDLLQDPEELVERALYVASRAPAHEAARKHRAQIESALQGLTQDLEGMSKTAAAVSRKIEGRLAKELDQLETVILKGDDQHAEAVRRQVARLRTALVPSRKPQERVYSVFSFLFEYGWDLVPRLIEEIDVESHSLQEIEL